MAIRDDIADQTGTEPGDWEHINGPETGVGVEYWFEHIVTKQQVYVCDDQGHITIELANQC